MALAFGKRAFGSRGNRRLRVEHVQHLLPADVGRFVALGVVASMQPLHKADDARYAEQAIGAERCKTSYAFRSLLDAKTHLAFGSDWPVVTINPFLGMQSAVTGRSLDGRTFVPEQNISAEDALRCYTRGGAYAAGEEDKFGVIALGRLADFAILDTDILGEEAAAGAAEGLARTIAREAYVSGRRVWPTE